MERAAKNTEKRESIRIETPLGGLIAEADDSAVRAVRLSGGSGGAGKIGAVKSEILRTAKRELEEYFAGKRRAFTFPIELDGTDFQRAVWNELLKIPYGGTSSYGRVAAAIGRPRAARAVGMACNRNPLMIVVPCHRVLGADGSLTGYAGGLDVKARLLSLERECAGKGKKAAK